MFLFISTVLAALDTEWVDQAALGCKENLNSPGSDNTEKYYFTEQASWDQMGWLNEWLSNVMEDSD